MSQHLTKGRPTDDLLKCANCGGDPEWRDAMADVERSRLFTREELEGIKERLETF